MTTKEVFHGVPGILRPFKEYIEKKGLKKGDQVVYYGVPGTCTPFVELLGFAVRSLELEQVFVPMVDDAKARTIHHISDIGMQAGAAQELEAKSHCHHGGAFHAQRACTSRSGKGSD